MKKKITNSIVVLLVMGLLAGCGAQQGTILQTPDSIQESTDAENHEEMTANEHNQSTDGSDSWQDKVSTLIPTSQEKLEGDLYGDYRTEGGEIAFISDGIVMDGSYNEAVYKGIQTYALAAGVSFSYYIVNGDTLECYVEAIERAVSSQAEVVVCVGYDFGEPVGLLQKLYPQTSFLMIDSRPVDAEGDDIDIADNVHCVFFHEEESGYLAGYLAVMEGYRSLGFIGGKENPSVTRYGYGYLQGINDAAEDMELTDVTVNYWYADTYQPGQEISDKASEWYSKGTEIIFSCGGSLYKSVLEAAEQGDGLLIGVDVDQSSLSQRFVTSALKDLSHAVVISLDDYYASGGRWSGEFAGQEVQYGAKEDCVGVPVMNTEWRFKQVTKDDYYKLLRQVKFEEVLVSDETDTLPEVSIGVNYE